MNDGQNWLRLRLDYEHFLVVPAAFSQQLFDLLSHAKVVKEGYNNKDGPVMQDTIPGFDFVTCEYVAGAAARAKMLDKPTE